MKYLFVSDIHGSKESFDRILDYCQELKIDKIIGLGDYLYHGPRNPIPEGYNPKDLALTINEMPYEFLAVRGNCDAEVDQMVIKYPIMDTDKYIELNGFRFFLTHGHHFDENNLPNVDFDVFVSGHTHIPVLKKVDGRVFLNPGSVTLPKGGNPKSFAILSDNDITIYDLEFNEMMKLKL